MVFFLYNNGLNRYGNSHEDLSMLLIQPAKQDFIKAGVDPSNLAVIQEVKQSQDEDSKTCFYLATFVFFWADIVFKENEKYQFGNLGAGWALDNGFWSFNVLKDFKVTSTCGKSFNLNTMEYSIALNLICLEHKRFMDHKYYGDVAANRIVQLRNYLNIFLALNKDHLNAQLISEFVNFGSEKK